MEFSAVAEIYHAYKGRAVNSTIAPDDQMFVAGQGSHYFRVGEDGVNNVLASLARSRCQTVQHILDLPCGHGRVAPLLDCITLELYKRHQAVPVEIATAACEEKKLK